MGFTQLVISCQLANIFLPKWNQQTMLEYFRVCRTPHISLELLESFSSEHTRKHHAKRKKIEFTMAYTVKITSALALNILKRF